jgi:ectoine hydroxylase-related dioxygenase (phytanoyl-CoA dioxygenase family)
VTCLEQGWTSDLRRDFDERGLAVVRGAVEASAVGEMSARIWALLERRRVPRAGALVTASRFRSVAEAGTFRPLLAPAVRAALDDVLGAGRWRTPQRIGQVLLHFPNAARWELPSRSWHLDHRAPGDAEALPALQVFLVVDPVAPGGGGTLAIEGTHRCIDRVRRLRGPGFAGSSGQLRSALREVPWLRELWTVRDDEDRAARFVGVRHEHEGIGLRVVEMTGEPGDVFVMHPWLVHAGSPNATDRARVMVTERFPRVA